MAKKTKAQLERELKMAQKEAVNWQAACDRVNAKLGDECGKRAALEQKLESLSKKHEAFVLNFRGQTQRENETIADLRKKVAAQETRLMVAETAMQSMTIHIHLLTNQKGQNNA